MDSRFGINQMYTPQSNAVSSALQQARLARTQYFKRVFSRLVDNFVARLARRNASLAQIAEHAAANTPRVHRHGGFTAVERHLLMPFTIPWMSLR